MSANAADTVAPTVEPVEEVKEVATIDSIIEAIKNTTIVEKSKEDNAKEKAKDTTDADAAHAASAAEGRRLYIGNLAYLTTEEQLKEFFNGFSIESTSIPTNPRTGRAVGYAFVDLTTKEEADRAIVELSGNEVQERKVSVQLARKPGSTGPTPRKEKEAASPPQQQQQQEEEAASASNPENAESTPRKRGNVRRNRGGRGGRSKRGRGEAASGDEEKAATTNDPGQSALVESTNVKVDAPREEGSGSQHEGSGPNSFKAQKKKRGPPENGVPSSTKIMVANLPYELSEEKLKELFNDYQPESAKIALRPIPRYMVRKLLQRGEPRKGRGFGFVNLASEEMQKKAVEEMNGKEVEGREIAVKVAIDPQGNDDEKENSTGEQKAVEKEKDVAVENGAQPEAVFV